MKYLFGSIAVFLLIIGIIFNPLKIIGPGERGIRIWLGAVQPSILNEGLAWRTPLFEKIVEMDVKTQTINLDTGEAGGETDRGHIGLSAASKDLQDVAIAVVVNYHPDASKVNLIYQLYGDGYREQILTPLVQQSVKETSAKYTAEELVTKRSEFTDDVSEILAGRFGEKSAILERVNITNLQFSESFTQSIEAKVTAEQNALAAKNKLEQVKFEAEQKIETAKADAESIRIQAQALAQNKELVTLKAVQAWDGKLPVYMMGDSVPFISIPQ